MGSLRLIAPRRKAILRRRDGRPSRPAVPEDPLKNILSFDVEDWHQSTLDLSLPITRRVADNTDRILELCAAAGARGTFFVLGLVAQACPDLVRRIAAAGHEVALHGHAHAPVHAMTRDAFREDLRLSRGLVEQAAGVAITGYRAPDFSITRESYWALQVLAEEGFRYDSSLFPFDGPRYGIAESFPLPYGVLCPRGDLLEFPLATTSLFGRRLPAAGGGYFRLFPYGWNRRAVRRLNRLGGPAVTYFHPYEIDAEEIPRSPHRIPLSLRLSQGTGRSGVARRLERLLRDFAWTTAAGLMEAEGARLAAGRRLDLRGWPQAEARFEVADAALDAPRLP
jgi:polysaccharide deacetylase family protein (PEP-CTERM system associated)